MIKTVFVVLLAIAATATAWQITIVSGDDQTFPIYNSNVQPFQISIETDSGSSIDFYDDLSCTVVLTVDSGCTAGTCDQSTGCSSGTCQVFYNGGGSSATVAAESPATAYLFSVQDAAITLEAALQTGDITTSCTYTTTNITAGGTTTPTPKQIDVTTVDTCIAGYSYTTATDTTPITAVGDCVACPAGSAAANPVAGTCPKCGEGTFASQPASTSCLACATGSVAKAGSSNCKVCPGDSYNPENSAECDDVSDNSDLITVLTVVGIVLGTFALGVGILVFVKKPWINPDAPKE